LKEILTYTDGEDLREDVKAMNVKHPPRKSYYMLRLTPEAVLIFKKAQFADAQNMLTKG